MSIRDQRRTGIPAIPAMQDQELYSTLQALRQVLVRSEKITEPMAQETGAWTSYTPAITPFAGAYTAVQGTGRYKQFGKTVHFALEVKCTSKGTATGFMEISLPVGPTRFFALATVVETTNGESDYIAIIDRSETVLRMWEEPAYADPHTDGRRFLLSGTYEVV